LFLPKNKGWLHSTPLRFGRHDIPLEISGYTNKGTALSWFAEKGGFSVTHLRQMMLEELNRRNYAQTAIDLPMSIIDQRLVRSP